MLKPISNADFGEDVPGLGRAWAVYFEARDELVWEWRYCDDWAEPARFYVLFDGRGGTVRSTQAMSESLALPFVRLREYCSR